MNYVEFLIPEDQQYEFVYPTVVGPRYLSASDTQDNFAKNPYLKEGQSPTYAFDIDVTIDMPFPIVEMGSTSHNTDINFISSNKATLTLEHGEEIGGNRDVIIQYELSGEGIASGIQTFDNGKEKFFLCQVEPPQLSYKPEINAREFIFVMDVSGSMGGFPLDISKKLMRNLLNQMRPIDKFNILFFSGGSWALSDRSLNVNTENISKAFSEMNKYDGRGGTELLPALKKAMSFKKQDGYSRSFVIVTDGYVAVEEEAFKLIATSLNQANFFAFGIGTSVNRYLIEGMANVGRGLPFIVTDQKYAHETANRLKKYMESPVLTDIEIVSDNIETYDVIPESTPDLLAQRPIYYFGKFKDGFEGSLTISGTKGNEKWSKTMEIPEPSDDHQALSYLWAREKIRLYDDFNTINVAEHRIDEITKLGLEYNLLTKYTSFVAVDHTVVNKNAEDLKSVKQPLPLPQGVSNLAVGFEMDLGEFVGIDGTTLVVDVVSTDRLSQKIIDAALEAIFSQMSQREIQQLIDAQINLTVENGRFVLTDTDKKHLTILKVLEGKLLDLGIPLVDQVIEINIFSL